MRTLKRNKQRMFYALFVGTKTVYETDDDGNVVYVEVDGEQVPVEAGTKDNMYGTPIEFSANISSKLNELHAREFGVDQSSIYSTICVPKGQLPLEYGALIWKDSKIEWDDESQGIPSADSSDYTVKGILTEYIDYDWFLLQRNN